MADGRLPLLRGHISDVRPYASPSGGGRSPQLPSLDPHAHGRRLLAQIDALAATVHARADDARDEAASREIVAVRPQDPTLKLDAAPLGSKPDDARVIGEIADTGVVLLDVASPDLAHLRKKISAFADDAKVTHRDDGTSSRKSEKAIAPIGTIGLAILIDKKGPRFRASGLGSDATAWFEVSCRGGYRRGTSLTATSREQIGRQLMRVGAPQAFDQFLAAELVVFFVRMTPAQADRLVDATDCIYEVELAAPPLRDMKLAEEVTTPPLRSLAFTPPSSGAPAVVILDTGIASTHPLLEGALLSATTAGAGIDSAEDRDGHGTKMAGVALYENLGAALLAGRASPPFWLQSSRLLVRPGAGTADDGNESRWPVLTDAAIRSAEAADPTARQRVFALAVTRSTQDEPLGEPRPTTWSHALDQLAYGDGTGRLIVVSAGNARDEQQLALVESYPHLQLSERIHQPSQAYNVLTVGAYTERTVLPPGAQYAEAIVIAPAGGIAPCTSCGATRPELPNKPDVVLEGGNLAATSLLLDHSVPTLCTLTTSNRHPMNHPLAFLSKTSEATARAARFAADIWSAEPDLRPETVRALIVHSASWTPVMVQQFPSMPDRLMACGHGVPSRALARECARDRATAVVEDAMPNAVMDERVKDPPPKRASTPPTELKPGRRVKFFRLPVPSGLGEADPRVELRVTLSYFAEPSTFGSRVYQGLRLKWDMQGPQETEEQFHERINKMMRAEDEDGRTVGTPGSSSFAWDLGIRVRSRGTVQSDRWRGPLSFLAGDKLIAVVPVLGWWDRYQRLQTEEMRFSLLASVTAPDIYSSIKPRLEASVEV